MPTNIQRTKDYCLREVLRRPSRQSMKETIVSAARRISSARRASSMIKGRLMRYDGLIEASEARKREMNPSPLT